MSKLLEIALGIVTSIGGFLDVGAIAVTNKLKKLRRLINFHNVILFLCNLPNSEIRITQLR